MPITHSKISTITDSTSNTALVLPSDWNASHVISGLDATGLTVSRVIGGWKLCVSSANASVTAATAVTIAHQIPINAKIDACQIRINSAVAEAWAAYYNDGSDIQTLVVNGATAKNIKKSIPFNCVDSSGTVVPIQPSSWVSPITDALTDIVIKRNSDPGNDAFTAQGNIKSIIYYWTFATMVDAS